MPKYNISQLPKKAAEAMREAVHKVVVEHKKTGIPLSVWKNGKVVSVSAKRIKLS